MSSLIARKWVLRNDQGIQLHEQSVDAKSNDELLSMYERTVLISVQTQKCDQNKIANQHEPGDDA